VPVGNLRLVALTGNVAPGTGGQTFYPILGFGQGINNRGQVVFSGNIFTAAGLRAGIWFETSPGQTSLVALGGNPAPGLPGKTMDASIFGNPSLNNNGEVAFWFGYKPYPVDSYGWHSFGVGSGIWSNSGGNGLRLVAADGLPLPINGPGPILVSVDLSQDRSLNDSGQTLFSSYDGTNTHLWVDTPNQAPREVINTLSAVPGVPGAKFEDFSPITLSNSGRVAFSASLTTGQGGVTDANRKGVWQESPGGSLQLLARTGQVAPDTGGYTFAQGFEAFQTSSGHVAFTAILSGPSSYNIAIYEQDAAGQLIKIAHMGDTMPGVPGATLVNMNAPLINDAGQIAFLGVDSQLADQNGNPTRIWSNGLTGGLAPIVQVRQHLPGMPAGNVISYLNGLDMNDAGQVLFSASYGVDMGPYVTDVGIGIWAQDLSGVLHPILLKGDLVDVDPGPGIQLRTVNKIDGELIGNSESRTFNELGQIALNVGFADGSYGLFVSNQLLVPEPVAWTACLIAFVVTSGCVRTGRHRRPVSARRRKRRTFRR
jgi:hypothetical protein